MTINYFTFLKNLTVAEDGLEKVNAATVLSPEFQQLVNNTYSQYSPARYSSNKIKRGVRWGILANDEISWSNKNTYQVSEELNPEEAGRVREIDQIPDTFLGSRVVRDLIDRTFHLYHPGASSNWQPYVVQLSALRYEPTLTDTCYPSPDAPHQDGFNNAIWVLQKTPGLTGGQSRIFSLDKKPLFETNLEAGDGLMIEDAKYFHQVLPMLVNSHTAKSDLVCRDILIIRIDPATR